MQTYALLMIAAAWHALGIGTVGLRGRIVAGVSGCGFLWGALTPPWGWVQIGCAVATVTGIRWSVTEHGRATMVVVGRSLIGWTAETLRACCRAVMAVLSPPRTHEAPPVPVCEPVSPPGDTAEVRLPHGDRWGIVGPVGDSGDTAQETVLTPLETWASVVDDTAAGRRPFNETARYVLARFGKSRSTFARAVARVRNGEEEAA